MTRKEVTDVCLLLEGTYPFVQGGVSSWTHALIQAAPHLTFTVVSLLPDRKPREAKYKFPPNVRRHELVYLDSGFKGRRSRHGDEAIADAFCKHMQQVLKGGSVKDLIAASVLARQTGCGQNVLLNSRAAWRAMERAYGVLLPSAPLVEFFWTWRVMVRSVISIIAAPLPESRVFHAICTGYAGVYGARAHFETGAPLLITEHGIYTNERRIEIGLADWLFDSGRDGFSVSGATSELRDLWQSAFSSFAKLSYDAAKVITTLYTGNQTFQLADGADRNKLRVIPNGVDYAKHARIPRDTEKRRPTVALIGRVVPIKDVRTFIFACAALKRRVPDVRALILGPQDEDDAYSAECRQLVVQEGLEECISFEGRVDVGAYLGRIDVVALTSVSEAQPLVLLEAGAAGVPSVATDVGSCREILEGFANDSVLGHGGIVAPVGDYVAIANALERLLTDNALHASMSNIMRRRVETTYNKLVVDCIYNELYDSMLVADREEPVARSVTWPA